MTSRAAHWDRVWDGRDPASVTWYEAAPHRSLQMVRAAAPEAEARIIDVGGGPSTLVDHLVDLGYRHVTVLDVSAVALEHARERLGDRASHVTWLVGDVLDVELPGSLDVWHDRAVFHFVTDPHDIGRYAERAAEALVPGGALVIGTFAMDGPDRCSGLPVVRYDAASLAVALGSAFEPVAARVDDHVTPTGTVQRFQFASFRRR